MSDTLLKVENLDISYGDGLVAADVSFSLKKGELLAVVGESGCGKTSLLRAVLGLPDSGVMVESGKIEFDGANVLHMARRERSALLGEKVGMIFQDPGAAFNPIRSYKKQFAEMLKSHGRFKGEKSYNEILDCFQRLNLPDSVRILKSCPYEMSGGMNQRIAIAAAMLLKPSLLLLDEPTSALDTTTQKTVVEELMRLRALTGITMLMVTHNLGIAAVMADKIGVMYAGRLVEYGAALEVLSHPIHPYTRSLIAAIPTLGCTLPEGIDGQPPLYGAEAVGCSFIERCPYASEKCLEKDCSLTVSVGDHYAACGEGQA